MSTGGWVLVGRGYKTYTPYPLGHIHLWTHLISVSTGGCVLVGRGYERVHRWVCPSG